MNAAIRGRRFSPAFVKPRGGGPRQDRRADRSGKVRPVIEKVFPLEQVGEAHRLSEAGHVRGKIVLKVS